LADSAIVNVPAKSISWVKGTQFVAFKDGSKLTPALYQRLHEGNANSGWAEGIEYFVLASKESVRAEDYNNEVFYQSALEEVSTKLLAGSIGKLYEP
jgi:hypothetical protein